MPPRPKIIVGGRGYFFHFKAKVCIIELFNLNFTGPSFGEILVKFYVKINFANFAAFR